MFSIQECTVFITVLQEVFAFPVDFTNEFYSRLHLGQSRRMLSIYAIVLHFVSVIGAALSHSCTGRAAAKVRTSVDSSRAPPAQRRQEIAVRRCSVILPSRHKLS